MRCRTLRHGADSALELWGGIECTVNRVGDRYFNQLERNGHLRRADDLDRISELGIRKLRYPLLWELMEPDAGRAIEWHWADERLARLQALDIQPIVGLLHHGSGPPRTGLAQPGFAEALARYAGQVAARYPWVEWYTPVNEPLTTARFSGLYGLWFPHGRDDRTFVRALINQCRGIVLSMQAIRRVNLDARLLQTDDLGRTFSTPCMRYQADFDNERRWLGWDLLCGKVDSDHPLHSYLLRAGVHPAELDWFCEEPCSPDMIGVNHYVTSDRFLDECCDLYPPHAVGSNGKHRYADVEAVRAVSGFDAGWDSILAEATTRYDLPVALTEVHLGCTREEQLRWFSEAWSAAQRAREHGRDVRAVTAWALFGSFNWNSLLTRDADHYEPGAFDVRAGEPRPTALAQLLRATAGKGSLPHPVLEGTGWWRRPQRTLFATPIREQTGQQQHTDARTSRPLLICGQANERVRAFQRLCEIRGLEYRTCISIHDPDSQAQHVEAILNDVTPWAVVNFGELDECNRAAAADCKRAGATCLGVALREPECQHKVPLLRIVGAHSARPLAEEQIRSNAHASSLMVVAPVVATIGSDDEHRLHSLLNGALDLLIDGESGVWLLPSLKKL